jgi:Rha family phage regulatory protein
MSALIQASPMVQIAKGQALTSSLDVAEYFGKQHKNVLQSIETLEVPEDFNRLNFQLVDYTDKKGEKRPMYLMTKDGFTFLAMGFTGKKAASFKVAYINVFNEMEKLLLQQQNESWKQARLEGKEQRRELTDAIQEFVEYAKSQGSQNAHRYYSNITKMTYKCLGLLQESGKIPENFRDLMSHKQVGALRMAEAVAEGAILDCIDEGIPYKAVYELAKQAVDDYAKTVLPRLRRGKSPRCIKTHLQIVPTQQKEVSNG